MTPGRPCKPQGAIDIRETYRDTMRRYPKTMALLAEGVRE